MTELVGGVSQIVTTEFVDEGVDFIWFRPMAVLQDLCGDDTVTYDYWCRTCGGQMEDELFVLQQLLERPAPFFLCFTPNVIAANGLCNMLKGWLFSSFWSQVTGQPENPCGPPDLGGG